MSTVSVYVSYNGIALVPSAANPVQFVINLPYTWTGATVPNVPIQFNKLINSELDAAGNQHAPSASLNFSSVTPNTLSNGSGSFAVTLVASNFLASTTAINYIFILEFDLTPNAGDTLSMTYGTVITNPSGTPVTSTITVNPTSALASSLTVDSITSNTLYPPAPVASLPAHPLAPHVVVPPPPIDTTVTIPVTAAPPTPNVPYLGVVFIVKMIFGAIHLTESTTTSD